MVDSLHTLQKSGKAGIDDYLLYSDNAYRQLFFGRSSLKVKEDIDYSLATVQKFINLNPTKAPAESKEKLDKIDDKIEKLKQQMKTLDEGKK